MQLVAGNKRLNNVLELREMRDAFSHHRAQRLAQGLCRPELQRR